MLLACHLDFRLALRLNCDLRKIAVNLVPFPRGLERKVIGTTLCCASDASPALLSKLVATLPLSLTSAPIAFTSNPILKCPTEPQGFLTWPDL